MAECGSAQELRAPNVGAGQAGAAGAPGAGWRPGLTELEEAEPGRRAGWLGGRSATGKRRREGEGQARAGEAERAAPATVWPRGDLGREGQNTRPRAVDAKGCLCPHGRALWSGQQLNSDKGTKPWRLSALLPGGGHRRRREHSSPFILGEICRAAAQPTSPQAAELAVSLATPTRICEGGEGTFCQGSGPPSPTWPRPAP